MRKLADIGAFEALLGVGSLNPVFNGEGPFSRKHGRWESLLSSVGIGRDAKKPIDEKTLERKLAELPDKLAGLPEDVKEIVISQIETLIDKAKRGELPAKEPKQKEDSLPQGSELPEIYDDYAPDAINFDSLEDDSDDIPYDDGAVVFDKVKDQSEKDISWEEDGLAE